MHRSRMHPSCHVLEPGIEGSSSSLTSALDRRGARVLRTGLASRLGRMASCEFASRERAMNPEQVAPLDVHLLCRLDTRPPGPSSCSIFLQRVRSPRSPPLSLSLYICISLLLVLLPFFWPASKASHPGPRGPVSLLPLLLLPLLLLLLLAFPSTSPPPPTLPFAKQLASFNLLPANLRYIQRHLDGVR